MEEKFLSKNERKFGACDGSLLLVKDLLLIIFYRV